MARRVLPSRLELKRPEGSSREAPLANVIFTTCFYVSLVHRMPPWDPTETPRHFHSSTTSASACLTSVRTQASVSPRQSFSSLILASIRAEAKCSPSPFSESLLTFTMMLSSHRFNEFDLVYHMLVRTPPKRRDLSIRQDAACTSISLDRKSVV